MNACATATVNLDEHVIVEHLTQPPLNECLPGTCICWNDHVLAA